MTSKAIMLLFLSLMLSACSTELTDNTDQYLGIYECTKSNISFDDEVFLTDITVTVEKDSLKEGWIMVNSFSVELLDDGNFGEGPLEGGFDGNKIKFSHNALVPGTPLICYIEGTKI